MRAATSATWYGVLDVEPGGAAREIRAARGAAVADLDPTDRPFRVYNQAAEVLLDPARRTAYDEQLAAELDAREEARRDEPADETDDVETEPDPEPVAGRTAVP